MQGTDALKGYSPGANFLIAGCTAGVCAAIVTQPADTIKTRMQVWLATHKPLAGCKAKQVFEPARDQDAEAVLD